MFKIDLHKTVQRLNYRQSRMKREALGKQYERMAVILIRGLAILIGLAIWFGR